MEASVDYRKDREAALDIPDFSVLTAIQANIRRYGWQALTVRLAAITLTTLAMLFLPVMHAKHLPASLRIWPVVCLFIFWILDGHYKSLQGKYIDLYRNSVVGGINDAVDMAVQMDDRFNVAGLWRPMVALPYATLIGLIALAILGL